MIDHTSDCINLPSILFMYEQIKNTDYRADSMPVRCFKPESVVNTPQCFLSLRAPNYSRLYFLSGVQCDSPATGVTAAAAFHRRGKGPFPRSFIAFLCCFLCNSLLVLIVDYFSV